MSDTSSEITKVLEPTQLLKEKKYLFGDAEKERLFLATIHIVKEQLGVTRHYRLPSKTRKLFEEAEKELLELRKDAVNKKLELKNLNEKEVQKLLPIIEEILELDSMRTTAQQPHPDDFEDNVIPQPLSNGEKNVA